MRKVRHRSHPNRFMDVLSRFHTPVGAYKGAAQSRGNDPLSVTEEETISRFNPETGRIMRRGWSPEATLIQAAKDSPAGLTEAEREVRRAVHAAEFMVSGQNGQAPRACRRCTAEFQNMPELRAHVAQVHNVSANAAK